MAPKSVTKAGRKAASSRSRAARPASGPVRRAGSRSSPLAEALLGLPVEDQRLALLLTEAVRDIAGEVDVPEDRIRSLLHRLVRSGLLQERKASAARRALARALGPGLLDLDPVPHDTVEQARRLAALRASLLREGALTTATIAELRGMTRNNARQWISRHRSSHRLFTVAHEGETLVPAFLLGEDLDPRPEAHEAIRALREAGEDGWSLWAWFAMPSAWLGGRTPVEVLATDAELVAESARQRAASAA